MVLDAATVQQVEQWLRSKGVALACSNCGGSRIVALEMVGTPALQNGVLRNDYGLPFVALVCENCGHTRFFLATTMGLVGQPQHPPPP
jgi:predicted nucleic-acid-binding Zn-ribbon protein